MTSACTHEHEHDADGQERREVAGRACGDPQAAPAQERVERRRRPRSRPSRAPRRSRRGRSRCVLRGSRSGCRGRRRCPRSPPVASAHRPCATWVPPGTPLFHGSAQIVTRLRTVTRHAGPVGRREPGEQHREAEPTSPARPRATPSSPRKTHESTSAGPRSFWKKKNASTSRHAREHRPHVAPPRQRARAQPRPRRRRRLRQLAQQLDAPPEVRGQREHDQQPDRFHRLHAEQVDLDAARSRVRCRRAAAAPPARRRARAEAARRGAAARPRSRLRRRRPEQDDPDRRRRREQLRGDRVAHRIPQRHHRHQADAAQQHQRRQQQRIVVAPPPPPEQVRQPEGGDRTPRPPSRARRLNWPALRTASRGFRNDVLPGQHRNVGRAGRARESRPELGRAGRRRESPCAGTLTSLQAADRSSGLRATIARSNSARATNRRSWADRTS